MTFRPRMLFVFLLLATPVLGQNQTQAHIPIAGSVNQFRTDTRVFNPSYTQAVEVAAFFFPGGNVNNAERGAGAIPPTRFTVGPRQMRVFDDVVASLFNMTGIGGISMFADRPFYASSRIYAQTANGTLGQFAPAATQLIVNPQQGGVLTQLKQSSLFRTNVGGMNACNCTAVVTWKLYDKNNLLVGTKVETMPPFAVLNPSRIDVYFGVPATTDISDAWISFSSAGGQLAMYASVVDNLTTDQYYVPAQPETENAPPQGPTSKVFDVTLQNFAITVTPSPDGLKVGDQVTMRIRNLGGAHGFAVQAPNFQAVVPNTGVLSTSATVERSFTISLPGSYAYFCTFPSCGFTAQHEAMSGDFTAAP